VIIPLTKPGIVAGSILVFIPSIGAFIQPDLLGGGKKLMLGSLVQFQFATARNWPFGAAVSMILLAFVMLCLMWYARTAPPGPEPIRGWVVMSKSQNKNGFRPVGAVAGLGAWAFGFMLFLYLPIVILVLYSFNASKLVMVWSGFSLDWYAKVFDNADIRRATLNSLIVASSATVCATVLATLAALVIVRGGVFRGRGASMAVIALPLMVPEIVTAVALLIVFAGTACRWVWATSSSPISPFASPLPSCRSAPGLKAWRPRWSKPRPTFTAPNWRPSVT